MVFMIAHDQMVCILWPDLFDETKKTREKLHTKKKSEIKLQTDQPDAVKNMIIKDYH